MVPSLVLVEEKAPIAGPIGPIRTEVAIVDGPARDPDRQMDWGTGVVVIPAILFDDSAERSRLLLCPVLSLIFGQLQRLSRARPASSIEIKLGKHQALSAFLLCAGEQIDVPPP